MAFHHYHLKYQEKTDEDIQKRLLAKKLFLKEIFAETHFITTETNVKVAILGCAEKRFVKGHKILLEELFQKPVDVTTMDISTNHLVGEIGVLQHDVTLPLPNTPFDMTFADVLLKFVPRDKQWNVVENAYEALKEGGIAVFILNKEENDVTDEKLKDGYNPVMYQNIIKNLKEKNITHMECELSLSNIESFPITCLALVLKK